MLLPSRYAPFSIDLIPRCTGAFRRRMKHAKQLTKQRKLTKRKNEVGNASRSRLGATCDSAPRRCDVAVIGMRDTSHRD
jgi:hypothetical protein